MHHTYLEPDPNGIFVGSSYVYSSGRDWARLGLLSLNKGQLNGVSITDPSWFERGLRPNTSSNEANYGYQFWLNAGGNKLRWPDLPEDAFAMLGNRSQVVMMIPSTNTVIVRLGWSSSPYPTNQRFAEILDALE